MADNAYSFIEIATIFPFILVFYFAGLIALFCFGLVFFITGLKNKWSELNKAGRILKIIKIILGILLLIVAILATIYITIGFIELGQRGSAFSNGNNNKALILSLLTLL